LKAEITAAQFPTVFIPQSTPETKLKQTHLGPKQTHDTRTLNKSRQQMFSIVRIDKEICR